MKATRRASKNMDKRIAMNLIAAFAIFMKVALASVSRMTSIRSKIISTIGIKRTPAPKAACVVSLVEK